jgi:single-strand DNA-binding protein
MNKGFFVGNLGRDAEMRSSQTGDTVCNFSLAVNVGTRQNEETMWVDCKLWGARGEKLMPYLKKGSRMAVEGKIKLDTYQTRDGAAKTVLVMTVGDLELIGERQKRDDGVERHETPKPKAPTRHEDMNDEIPF